MKEYRKKQGILVISALIILVISAICIFLVYKNVIKLSPIIFNILFFLFVIDLMVAICIGLYYDLRGLSKKIKNGKVNKKGLIIVIISVIIILGCVNIHYYNVSKKTGFNISTIIFHKSFNDISKQERNQYLTQIAENTVSKQLKAPATAEYTIESITPTSDNHYEIIGDVDSENSFGAKLRSEFWVEIKVDNEFNENTDASTYNYTVTNNALKDNDGSVNFNQNDN